MQKRSGGTDAFTSANSVRRQGVVIKVSARAQQLLQKNAIVLPRFTSHAELISCPEFADFLIHTFKPAVRVLFCHCGISMQQNFASDVLEGIAVCMYRLLLLVTYMCGSACCIVTCLYLRSETCIVTIILMGQA